MSHKRFPSYYPQDGAKLEDFDPCFYLCHTSPPWLQDLRRQQAKPSDRLHIILVQHTETDDIIEGRYSGDADVQLNRRGFERALSMAEELRHFKVKDVWCSDRQRAVTVARIIALPHHASVTADARLREVDVGRMGRMDKETATRLYPDRKYALDSPNLDYTDMGGETGADLLRRHREVFDDLATLNDDLLDDSSVVIVGHGSSLNLFATSIDPEKYLSQDMHEYVLYPFPAEKLSIDSMALRRGAAHRAAQSRKT